MVAYIWETLHSDWEARLLTSTWAQIQTFLMSTGFLNLQPQCPHSNNRDLRVLATSQRVERGQGWAQTGLTMGVLWGSLGWAWPPPWPKPSNTFDFLLLTWVTFTHSIFFSNCLTTAASAHSPWLGNSEPKAACQLEELVPAGGRLPWQSRIKISPPVDYKSFAFLSFFFFF